MRYQQLTRPPLDEARVAELYSEVHRHEAWTDHRLRVPLTTQVANWLIKEYDLKIVADLSCGDGEMLRNAGGRTKIFGDIVDSPDDDDVMPYLSYVGPIQETIRQVGDLDLLICAETLEHLVEPQAFLNEVRVKTRSLVLSTPVGSWDDPTPGHYWAWDREWVESLLAEVGFGVVTYVQLEFTTVNLPHDFGIWGCV